MHYLISIMCTYNVSVSSHVAFARFNPLNSYELCIKELTVQDTSKRSVYAAAFSVVLIGHVKTHVGTQAISPPPTPLFVSSPLSGVQEDRGGRGRSRCWSSPASWAPTAFSHGSDPSYMPVASCHI